MLLNHEFAKNVRPNLPHGCRFHNVRKEEVVDITPRKITGGMKNKDKDRSNTFQNGLFRTIIQFYAE